jgi:hypothetical protein
VPVEIELDLGRRRLAQRRHELGPEAQRVAEAAEQPLLRVLEDAPERIQSLAVRPDAGRRDEHTRVLLGLEQDLDAPGLPLGGRRSRRGPRLVPQGILRLVVAVGLGRLTGVAIRLAERHQPEAGTEHAPRGVPLRLGPPVIEPLGQRAELPGLSGNERVLGLEDREPDVDRRAWLGRPGPGQQPASVGVDEDVE